mmetsp:Transcript_89484/g.213830  ORF Transcript_89484/g.213830 Transcript_89484/m.213830 type:complete len:212 (-) Transcript_89484:2546-3181(-)
MDFLPAVGQLQATAHGLRKPCPGVEQIQQELLILHLPPHHAPQPGEYLHNCGLWQSRQRGQLRFHQQRGKMLDGCLAEAYPLALLQCNWTISGQCRPHTCGSQVVLLEPVGAGMVPGLDHLREACRYNFSLLWGIIWKRRLSGRDLQRGAPLRVAVQLDGKFRLLEPEQHIVQGLAIFLWEAELQRLTAFWTCLPGQHEAEGMCIRHPRII